MSTINNNNIDATSTSNNNNDNTKSNMPEPSLLDIYQLLQNNATKQDMDVIKEHIDSYKTATEEKFEKIDQKVNAAASLSVENANQIESLQESIEQLKQEQLKCNICVSGVPPNLIINDNTGELIIQIALKLGVDINRSQFSSYAIAKNKFIIVKFHEIKHKQQLLGKLRARKSLMVEEVFSGQSNSQIYINDHLTQYFNNLYLIARQAKKGGNLASATSFGGKIRARKNRSDAPILITNEKQLRMLIDTEQSDTQNIPTQPEANDMDIDGESQTSKPSRSSSANRNRNNNRNRKSETKENTIQSSPKRHSKKRSASTNREDKTVDKKKK